MGVSMARQASLRRMGSSPQGCVYVASTGTACAAQSVWVLTPTCNHEQGDWPDVFLCHSHMRAGFTLAVARCSAHFGRAWLKVKQL
jgi:hypothetical protein